MAGRIPQHFIDDLISRVDIIEVIDERVPLKKKGREYMACCPFHNEKTPSFSVSPTKQFYHCFGCGAHGTAIGFLMDYEHMDFVEAIEDLATSLNLAVPHEEITGPGHNDGAPRARPDLYTTLAHADRFYRQQLRQHPQAERAIDYLRQRGLSGEIAAEFGLGYAPPGWDNLSRALDIDTAAHTALIDTGMLIVKDNGNTYDRFRGRIMFPIRDRRGRTIAFGGRVLPHDDTPGGTDATGGKSPGAANPKYLNSPETPVFHKGRELYGLYEARKALRDIPRLLVVEGYMDVVSLAQFDIRYVVATLGTATTRDHLDHLFRITSEVVFCFDGDRAGREAAWRALENALPIMREGRQIRFMFLPEGEDPDTRVRQLGHAGFEAEIANAEAFSNFFFEVLSNRTDIASIDGRARLVELARPLLSHLPAGVFRQMMITRLGELAQVEAKTVDGVLTRPEAPPRRTRATQSGRSAPSLVRTAVTALLQQPELAAQAGDTTRFRVLALPGIALLVDMIDLLQQHPHLGSGALLEHWRNTEHGLHLQRLATAPLLAEGSRLVREFTDTLARLEERCHEQRYDALLAKGEQLTTEEKAELGRLVIRLKGGGPVADPANEPHDV